MKSEKVMSIIIPTRNNATYIGACLQSIQKQTYPHIEVLVIDSNSTDDTKRITEQYGATTFTYIPLTPSGHFEATAKRNFGARQARGKYIYYLDADMELPPTVLEEAVHVLENGGDAVIVSEDSFGTGIWAKAKNLERQCYWGDNTIEAPRIVSRTIWETIGGLDEKVGGGGDDWDLYQTLLERGYKVGRIGTAVRHNEGNLSLTRLAKKRFMYGSDALKYIAKRPKAALVSYFPIRKAYIRNWRLFIAHPKEAGAFIIMRTVEYSAGILGALYTILA